MGRSGRKASPLCRARPCTPCALGAPQKQAPALQPSREAPEPRPGLVLPARAPSHLDAPGQGWTRDAARPGRDGDGDAGFGREAIAIAGPGRDGDARGARPGWRRGASEPAPAASALPAPGPGGQGRGGAGAGRTPASGQRRGMTRLGRAALGAPHSARLCTRGPPSSPNPNPAAASSRARPPGDCAMPTAVSSGLGLLKGPGSPAECRGEGGTPPQRVQL